MENLHMNVQSIFLIVPVYNEGRIIKSVIVALKKTGYKNIIVIDDGSSDMTFDVVKKTGVTVLKHRINRGKGAALKTGMEAAKQFHADVVVTFDGDGQHDPKDIVKLIYQVNKGYDVVLGSRYLTRQNIPWVRRVANACANVFTYLLYDIWVTDSQSGLRAYTKKAFEIIDTKSDRYEVESEALRDIKKYNLSYIEVPMRVRYTRYSLTKTTKQNLWSGFLTMMRLMLSK
jgi:glycosyltransferase involved in cell wall biosynthesis